jgi:hypothetical protein
MAEQYPADLLAVTLFDQGLTDLPGAGTLAQDDAAGDREAFEVIARELLFDFQPSPAQVVEIQALFGRSGPDAGRELVERLLLFHPLLGARVLNGAWETLRPPHRPVERKRLRGWRLNYAGLPATAEKAHYLSHRDALLERARQAAGEEAIPIADNLIREGLVLPAVRAVLHGEGYNSHDRTNLLVALVSAGFRHYLGLCLLDELETRL